MTNIEPSESKEVTVSKDKLANTADEMEKAAIQAAIAGQKEVIQGAERLQAAGEMLDDGTVMIAQGASDITQAVDQKIMSNRMSVLSDVVGTAGILDVAEGAEMLAASDDVEVLSALVGMMSEDSIDHGMELARLSGELQTAGEIVHQLRMPVLSAFLAERASRLHDMSVEQIRIAISTDGVSQLLSGTGKKVGTLGENEVVEGIMRLAVADAASQESAAMAASSEKLAMQGIEEMVVGQELGVVAKDEVVQGAAEISAGSTVIGAALAIDDVAATLKEKSE